MTRVIELGVIRQDKPDPRTAEQGLKCPSCGFTVTNSQPDCRCS